MLLNKINDDLKAAMRARDELSLAVLRMLIAAFKNKKIELKKSDDLSDEESIAVLRSEVKKRKDSIEAYRAGGREDLAGREEAEVKIIQAYLPQEMSEGSVRLIVKEAIAGLGPVGPSDLGKVMGAAMAKLKGQADGSLVQRVVKEELE